MKVAASPERVKPYSVRHGSTDEDSPGRALGSRLCNRAGVRCGGRDHAFGGNAAGRARAVALLPCEEPRGFAAARHRTGTCRTGGHASRRLGRGGPGGEPAQHRGRLPAIRLTRPTSLRAALRSVPDGPGAGECAFRRSSRTADTDLCRACGRGARPGPGAGVLVACARVLRARAGGSIPAGGDPARAVHVAIDLVLAGIAGAAGTR